jgi:hypothetical protein
MSWINEHPSPETLSLFLQNRLTPEERRKVLLHVASCNECSLEYALFSSMEALTEKEDCPPPEALALLLEGGLPDDEKTDVLRHIAECDECAVTCAMTREMMEAERKKKGSKFPQIICYISRFSKAAAVFLLVGIGFVSGFFYSDVHVNGQGSRISENKYANAVGKFESSQLYWNSLNNFIWRDELRIGAAKGASNNRDENHILPVWDILARKKIFDINLYRITVLSGRETDAILNFEGIDIPSMTSEDIEAYASLLKNNRGHVLEKAERWIRLDQKLYFSLVEHLPEEVWERYPVNRESFEILAWIAALPPNLKDQALELSPEEAKRAKQEDHRKTE